MGKQKEQKRTIPVQADSPGESLDKSNNGTGVSLDKVVSKNNLDDSDSGLEAEHLKHEELAIVEDSPSHGELDDELEDMDKLFEELRVESQENYNKYLRAVADLENQKKRTIKERAELIKFAGENILRDIVEVVDDLERALAQDLPGVNDELLKGIKLIYNRFLGILDRHEVKGETAIGSKFDPLKQEAVSILPSVDYEPGIVIEEFKKAYFFKGKLIRPAQVVVAAEVKPEQG